MNILLTGGAGHIGHVTAARLLKSGFRVRVIDNMPESDISSEIAEQIQGAEYRQVDIRAFEAVRASCEGMDAVVHLAAMPYPIHGKEVDLFQINVGGTFNVFQAAADTGIKRVVCASSINALGNGFGTRWIDVHYFPIDEAHPGYTTDAYAFSKENVEAIAAYFWRREGISSVCMRYPLVYHPLWFAGERGEQRFRANRDAYAILMAMPTDERRTVIDTLLAQYWDLRVQRDRGEITFREMFQYFRTTPGAALLFGYDDFWSVLDVRDAAKSIELALLADVEGCHLLYVADTHNSTGLPTRDLAALFYPDVQTWTRPIHGTESLLNSEKAQSLLGFEPDYSMRHLFEDSTG